MSGFKLQWLLRRIKPKKGHEQSIYEIYESHETYGKHPTSLVIKEAHVKYHFLFIMLEDIFLKKGKYQEF